MCRHEHWSSRGGGTDHTSETKKTWLTTTSSTPSLCSRNCKFTKQGVWNGSTSPHINFWDDYSVLNTDVTTVLPFPTQGTPCHCYPTKGTRTLFYKLSWNHNKTPRNGLISASPQHECVKLFRPPGVSNTSHKRQNSLYMYKCWRTFIKCCCLDIFMNYMENIGQGKTKAPWYYKYIIWNKNMTVCMVEWKHTGIWGLNDLINPCSSVELDKRCWASSCTAGFISATQINFRKLSPALSPWTSSCVTFLPHVLLVLHILLHAWPYILNSAPVWFCNDMLVYDLQRSQVMANW